MFAPRPHPSATRQLFVRQVRARRCRRPRADIDCNGATRRGTSRAVLGAASEITAFVAHLRSKGFDVMSCLFGCGLLELVDDETNPCGLPAMCMRNGDAVH
jgi:hypothetical protein